MKIICPSCSYETEAEPGTRLQCPRCETEIPAEAMRDSSVVAEELAPGLSLGQRLGGYVLEGLLGSGGMAVVFSARQISLNRKVAVKVLPQDLAENEEFVKRFDSEAAVLAALSHPNVVNVIDRGKEGDFYFFVMELVEGEDLKGLMAARERLTQEEALRIAEQTCDALSYAHKKGVIHRDIKPANIMITPDGVVKITDFGLAHLSRHEGDADLTQDLQVIGTLKYMAPEQLQDAKSVDARADVYSLGVVLYEMLTGELPLGTFPLPSEVDPGLDVRLDDVITKALRMKRAERYSTIDDMRGALHQIATTPRVTAAQRETEQEKKVSEVTPTAVVTGKCPMCGYPNPPTSQRCDKCGADLSEFFEKCPRCGAENRFDVPACAQCGADLASIRKEQEDDVRDLKQRAKSLYHKQRYDEALSEIRKILRMGGPRFEAVRMLAMQWAEQIEERGRQYRRQIYEAGERLVAEGRREDALKQWRSLPPDYEDAHERIVEVTAALEHARVLGEEADALARSGDLKGALERWQQMAKVLPHDPALRKRMIEARDHLTKWPRIQSFMQQAERAEAAGDFPKAMACCEKTLRLQPGNSAAGEMLERLRRQRDETLASMEIEPEAEDAPLSVVMPRRRRQHMRVPPLVFLLLGVLVLAVVLILVAIFLLAGSDRGEAAARDLLMAADSHKAGNHFRQALAKYEQVADQYPRTTAGQVASMRARDLRTSQDAARALCGQGDEAVKQHRYREALNVYRRVLQTEKTARFKEFAIRAEAGLQKAREGLVTEGMSRVDRLKRAGRLAEALRECRDAMALVPDRKNDIQAVLRNITAASARYDSALARAEKAEKAGEWRAAMAAYVEVLQISPDSAGIHEKVLAVVDRLPAPNGMVLIKRGDFNTGADGAIVTIAHSFYIDQCEVTNEAYARFVKAARHEPPPHWKGGTFSPGRGRHPVVNVTRHDAVAYCLWRRDGAGPLNRGYRLPTAKEWECAARGAPGRKYPWGDDWRPHSAVLAYGPAPVGKCAGDRTPEGCMDMAGNVAEWTAGRAGEDAIIKGNSWAGVENDRVARIIATDAREGDRVLIDSRESPRPVLWAPSDLRFFFTPTRSDDRLVVVQRWNPRARERREPWTSREFHLRPREEIGMPKGRTSSASTPRNYPYGTGCVFVEIMAGSPPVLRYRCPSGVERELAAGKPPPDSRARPVRLHADASLRSATLLAAERRAKPDERYLNVGFRCVRTAWIPPQ